MDKSLVTKATSPDEIPTPGYMFNEIARITQSSADACKQLIDFLIKRLKKDSVHVKLKVLRVIKHCCAQGHATFRRDMQRHTTEIKECLGARASRACDAAACASRSSMSRLRVCSCQAIAALPIHCTAMRSTRMCATWRRSA